MFHRHWALSGRGIVHLGTSCSLTKPESCLVTLGIDRKARELVGPKPCVKDKHGRHIMCSEGQPNGLADEDSTNQIPASCVKDPFAASWGRVSAKGPRDVVHGSWQASDVTDNLVYKVNSTQGTVAVTTR